MAVDPTPWLVGGGATHSPEVVRQSLYDSTSGAEGISSATALQVRAQATPNGTVRVAPGGAVLNNRYPGGAGQSYSARNSSQTSVPVTATGSAGGRTDAVILRILDPQYAGQPPADPNNFQYTRLEAITAPAGVKDISQLNLAYPAILLARITIPANTGTITNAMITDLRNIAQPRALDVWRPRPNVAADTELLVAAHADGEYFPNAGGEQWIDIPVWATRVQIRATWMGIRYQAGANFGEMWAEFGPYVRQSTRKYSTQRYMWDTAAVGGVYRTNWIVEDDVYIPADIRGTNQAFIMKARHANAGGAHLTSIDSMSGVSLALRFLQVADPSTT